MGYPSSLGIELETIRVENQHFKGTPENTLVLQDTLKIPGCKHIIPASLNFTKAQVPISLLFVNSYEVINFEHFVLSCAVICLQILINIASCHGGTRRKWGRPNIQNIEPKIVIPINPQQKISGLFLPM